MYVDDVAALMFVHDVSAGEEQSCHRYVYVIVGVPDHVPLFAVNVCATCTVPLIAGSTVFTGDAASTVAVCEDVAVFEPDMFDALTTTLIVDPTSLFASVYVLAVAPEMLAQPVPDVLQSSH